jgi:hypothetical protein
MLELVQNGYYPLNSENLDLYVPSRPGIYMLAIQLPNGVHQNFFTKQTDNLYGSLTLIEQGTSTHFSPMIMEYFRRYRCYFTYFVIHQEEYREEVEKMLAQTTDPLVKLKVINCN